MVKWQIWYLWTRYRSKLGLFFWFGPIHVTIHRNLAKHTTILAKQLQTCSRKYQVCPPDIEHVNLFEINNKYCLLKWSHFPSANAIYTWSSWSALSPETRGYLQSLPWMALRSLRVVSARAVASPRREERWRGRGRCRCVAGAVERTNSWWWWKRDPGKKVRKKRRDFLYLAMMMRERRNSQKTGFFRVWLYCPYSIVIWYSLELKGHNYTGWSMSYWSLH